MQSTAPIESYGELVEKFHGIEQLDPTAIGRFVFHAAIHMPGEDFVRGYTDEPQQDWHWELRSILRNVEDWRENPNGVSRYELAKGIEVELLAEKEQKDLIAQLEIVGAEDGYRLVVEHLKSKGYGIASELEASPLFPEGRQLFASIDESIDPETGKLDIPYNSTLSLENGDLAPDELREFLSSGYALKRAGELVKGVLSEIEAIGADELAAYTQLYGAKAASLLCFEKRLHVFNELTKDTGSGYIVRLDVPQFTAVSTDMYSAWKNDNPLFLEMVEIARQDAIGLVSRERYKASGGLVAIRSSAVNSEDGETSTGAGVYLSLAVDPFNELAFKDAVEQVYASTDSDSARSYRETIGVGDELMGLLIQRYVEVEGKNSRRDRECYWGNANSRGANPNIVDINTNEGVLLFDKNSVIEWLMVEAKRIGRHGGDNPHLHTHPDHDTPLRGAIRKTEDVAHAVVLAEKLFGKPMQVEFVNEKIVQVRPIVNIEHGEVVDFPEDEHLAELASVGVGDMSLGFLDRDEDNTGKEGYIVFDEEYEYSLQGTYASFRGQDYVGYRAFPDKGAVVILRPSSSGHIQAICREKGLLCVYPATNKRSQTTDRDELDELVHEYDSRGFRQGKKVTAFRFVSDGYKARLYKTDTAED